VTPVERVEALFGPSGPAESDPDALFVGTLDALARAAGAGVWLEKTPSNVYHVDRILRVAPDARFVEVVRDPRDIVASKKVRRANTLGGDRYRPEDRAVKRLAHAYDPLLDALGWKTAIRAGDAATRRHPGRVHRIRYEDLVRDPEARTREICAFAGVAYEETMLAVGYSNRADRADRTRGVRGGVSTASVGRWREVLEPAEVALCQWAAGRDAVDLGYDPEPVGLADRMRGAAGLGRSMVDVGARIGRRWRLGGRRFVRLVLGSYVQRVRLLGKRR